MRSRHSPRESEVNSSGRWQKAKRILFVGVVVATASLVLSCPPSALLLDVQDKVHSAQSSGEIVATPQISPAATGGIYSSSSDMTGATAVTITCSTSGAAIHYTTDGSTPTFSATTYSGPISVTGNGTVMTIKAIGTKSGMTDSAPAQQTYKINYDQVSTPLFSPGAETSDVMLSVNISTTTSGAYVSYTTDGSTPPSSGGAPAPVTVTVSSSMTLTAIAYKSLMADSPVNSAIYTLQVAAPTFSPNAGTYSGAQSLSIYSTTPGSSISYTTDGSNPPASGGVPSPASVSVSTSETVNAMAYKSGWQNSAVIPAIYKIQYSLTVQSDGNGTTSPGSGLQTTGSPIPISATPNLGYFFQNWTLSSGAATFGDPNSASTTVTFTGSAATIQANFMYAEALYVTNLSSNNISAFVINSTTGALTAVDGSPFSAGTEPEGLVVDPAVKFLYAANFASNNISGYAINSANGVLSAVNGSPFSGIIEPQYLVVDPTSKFLYVDTRVSAYTINGTTGALTAMSGSPFYTASVCWMSLSSIPRASFSTQRTAPIKF